MTKKLLIFGFVLIIIIGSIIIVWQIFYVINPGSSKFPVCFKNYCFDVELAKTEEEIARGLMFRENLEQDKGMLFIFQEEGEYSFWMKNTLIPLDIVWINQNKEVVFIKKNFDPCTQEVCPSAKPDKKAKYVLELNVGTVEQIGLKIGDKIIFDID